MEIDPRDPDPKITSELTRELHRLKNLQELRGRGIEIAVSTARKISDRLEDPNADVPMRDLNRSLEIVTKTAVMADEELRKSQRAEVEATAPQRNVVLIILESQIPDERKKLMLMSLAAEMGEHGAGIIYDALKAVSSEERANELLELEA